MKYEETTMLLNGNHAVSYGALRSRPQVIPVYPITPQSPIMEKLTELHTTGELAVDPITPESEHSAMAICITASLAGARVFTATASQGLMLMHEVLHYAAGARAPIVMANVNRTIGSPWGFWPDQTDSLAQRDTGWIQFYSENGQESLDTTIQAFKIAEKVMLPVMLSHEAFYVSHAVEPVKVPSQEAVDEYLPPFQPEHMLDPDIKESWGNVVNQEMFYRHRKNMGEAMERTFRVVEEAGKEWEKLTGRSGYGIIEKYRCEGAETYIVAMGSLCGTIRDAVDNMRDAGIPVGMLKVRLFRPFPVNVLREALAGVPRAIVMERNFSPGVGGFLHQELKAALFALKDAPEVHGYLTGVGGLNVSPEKVESVFKTAMEEKPSANSIWVG